MLVVIIFLCALIAASFVAAEVLIRRSGYTAKVPTVASASAHTFGPDATKFVGGTRIGWANSSYPFGVLTFDRDFAKVGGVTFGRPVLVERACVERVVPIKTHPFASGVRFQTSDGRYDHAIFWSFTPGKVVRRMAESGWPT